MELIDSHCHLQDERVGEAPAAVLARAGERGVVQLVCCGTRPADWARVTELASKHREITPAYGLHPWYVGESASLEWFAELRERLERDPGAGVGEIGVDAAIRPRLAEEQQVAFVQQLRLARELDRPVSVHCRRAWQALHDGLQAVGDMPRGLVIHSFSGSVELVKSLVALGVYFSFSGSITNPAYERARALVQAVPRERLLIETDAPDMLPHVLRAQGGLNEPANLHVVAERIAQFTGLSVESVAELTTENARRLFL